MSNPGLSNHGYLSDESDSSVQEVSPPPPDPPIEISETEMSTDSNDNQYGF
ncbi:hypothetical protein MKW92_004130, partial [Papaver armeniacum]